MNTNIRERELLKDEGALDEPHFDEEATVLSARPVVPLDTVEQQASSKRRWALALAIVLPLLIGAVGAALVYKVRTESTSNIADVDNQTALVPPSLEAGIKGIATDEDESKPQPESLAEAAPKKAVTPRVESREPTENISRRPRRSERENENWDDEIAERELEREARRAEKRENRRIRRAEKEARDNNQRRSDDLLRIREIFEGTRRP